MDRLRLAEIREHAAEFRRCLEALPLEEIARLAGTIERIWQQDGTVFTVGNGGSAATASHMAADLARAGHMMSTVTQGRAIAIPEATASVTAWANDESFDVAFARRLGSLARRGDLLVAISASGNSLNLVECVELAGKLGMETASLVGRHGGVIGRLTDISITADSDLYGVIEDVHLAVNHMVARALRGPLPCRADAPGSDYRLPGG